MTPIKHIFITGIAVIAFSACNNSEKPVEESASPATTTTTIVTPAPASKPAPEEDPKVKLKIGKDKDGNVSGDLELEQ